MGTWDSDVSSGIQGNVREWLEEAESRFREPIEAIVCGKDVVLSRDEGLAKMDRVIDAGHGAIDSEPMYAWSASRVFFIHEYDGQLKLAWLPREPAPCQPEFGGVKEES